MRYKEVRNIKDTKLARKIRKSSIVGYKNGMLQVYAPAMVLDLDDHEAHIKSHTDHFNKIKTIDFMLSIEILDHINEHLRALK